jgi:hypothetical protein
MNIATNIKAIVDQLVATLHEPAVQIWHIALLQNRVYIYEDLVGVLFFVALIFAGHKAFKQYDPDLVGYIDFPAWLVLAGAAWLASSIGILLLVLSIIQRVVNPEWSAACDLINTLQGST